MLGTLLCSLTTWSDGDDTESVDDSALWDAVSLSLMTRLVGSPRFFRLYRMHWLYLVGFFGLVVVGALCSGVHSHS